jgi:peptide/nickel transport system ATP-binding protein
MSEPVLSVRGLRTHFFTRAGVVKAVDDVSFDIAPREVMGLVGESGSGKSITGYSIMGLVDPPGRIVEGSIVLDGIELVGLPPEQMRQLRGNRVAMIFQDPMMTLNPVLRIDRQMIEAILRRPTSDCSPTRTSSRAACASVLRLPSRCSTGPISSSPTSRRRRWTSRSRARFSTRCRSLRARRGRR